MIGFSSVFLSTCRFEHSAFGGWRREKEGELFIDLCFFFLFADIVSSKAFRIRPGAKVRGWCLLRLRKVSFL
jgi:hypothetical protein